MIISKTPLRISFFGGGTDLPTFYKKNNYGAVVSSSINKFLYVTLKKQNSLFEEKYRLNYYLTEHVDDINKIQHPVIKECFKFMNIDEHLYVSTIADAPSSTGLGSSSSFCVGLLNALYKFKGISVSKQKLAEEASYIEINKLNLSLGKQDHYCAVYGGLNFIKFFEDEKVEIKKIKNDLKLFFKLKKSMIIFWTRLQRSAEPILKEQSKNNYDNTEKLKVIRSYAEEFYKYLKYNDDISLEYLGKMLNDSWEIKKSLSEKISLELIDEAYLTAMKSGALGGKICGAGGGGFLMFLAEPQFHSNIISNLRKFNFERYTLDFIDNGSQVFEID